MSDALPIYINGEEMWADHDDAGGPGLEGWVRLINATLSMHVPAAANLLPGYLEQVSSATADTLVYTSKGVRSYTGSTAQPVTLPTTSVTAEMALIILNNSSATLTVKSSSGATIATVAANGGIGVFVAAKNTPTLATDWFTYFQKTFTNPIINGYTEGVQALGVIGSTVAMPALTGGTYYTGTLTTAVASVPTLPFIGQGQSILVDLTQCASSTGGTYAFAAFSGQTLKWTGGTAPTPTATNSKIDSLIFRSPDGTTVIGTIAGQNT